MSSSRREFLVMGVAAAATNGVFAATADALPGWADIPVLDQVKYEHVMDIVIVTDLPVPVSPGGSAAGPDGEMVAASTIVGGRFEGVGGLRGKVVPGNAYSPVVRPDGVTTTEALYRLRSVDGYQIIVHDKGLILGGGDAFGAGVQRQSGSPRLVEQAHLCLCRQRRSPRSLAHGQDRPARAIPPDSETSLMD